MTSGKLLIIVTQEKTNSLPRTFQQSVSSQDNIPHVLHYPWPNPIPTTPAKLSISQGACKMG